MAVRPWINLTKTTKNSTKPARVKNKLSTDDFSRIKTSLIALQTSLFDCLFNKAAGCFSALDKLATLGNTQLFIANAAIHLNGFCRVVTGVVTKGVCPY
ncbi:hypothetical protein [Pseudomonas simiae]|uniref:hypothetical protein n=1 Tax=Pseudomonas simiae TaxID=321846 RepID=UPI00139234ED|nr:hypothetical protein [Pseudomonas simiae]MBD8739790.1 hypothetical protein [Pseudomonas fluorescens]MBC3964361.1 hypothetical protein [Pseudomonas simiae]NVH61577.1 hypothetical protein [Pseudomonas simiae]QQD30303.1 hypothetical protein ICJ33_09825 [Pseudomonas simiae]UNK69277.1 hypothetical protein MNO08_09405 [Pseudomonas simiae]